MVKKKKLKTQNIIIQSLEATRNVGTQNKHAPVGKQENNTLKSNFIIQFKQCGYY